MLICVHSDIIGTPKNLVYSNGEYTWTNSVPPDAWVYGDRTVVKSLDVLFEFLRSEIPLVSCASHVKAFQSLLGVKMSQIPWHAVLPKEKFNNSIRDLIIGLEDGLERFLSDQYHGNFISQREFLLSLSRASIDVSKLSQFIKDEKNQTILSTLNSFRPVSDQFAEKCVYNQASTLTGRLTVSSGPQVLILPKRHKQLIKSRFVGGEVYQVDFVSLEPRVARLATGQPASHDVYLQLSKELFGSTLTREQCKIAVLCALYGASRSRLSKMIGSKHNPGQVIKKIQDFFGVNDILSSIKPELKKEASFRNYFGRKIEPDRSDDSALVNYFIQSSAVDAAMIGFSEVVKKINKKLLKCMPIFVIHDAILFDVHPDHKKNFFDVLSGGINIPTLGEFPVTISAIADGGE